MTTSWEGVELFEIVLHYTKVFIVQLVQGKLSSLHTTGMKLKLVGQVSDGIDLAGNGGVILQLDQLLGVAYSPFVD